MQVEKNSLHFKGSVAADKNVYELNLKLLKEIQPEKTKYQVKPRCIEFALEKAEEGPYWERLLETRTKQHWLKVDFSKWKDEDDSDEEAGGGDLEDVMRNMGDLDVGGEKKPEEDLSWKECCPSENVRKSGGG